MYTVLEVPVYGTLEDPEKPVQEILICILYFVFMLHSLGTVWVSGTGSVESVTIIAKDPNYLAVFYSSVHSVASTRL